MANNFGSKADLRTKEQKNKLDKLITPRDVHTVSSAYLKTE